MTKFFTPRVRRWIYSVCIAAVPVLVYFQLLPAEAAPTILPLILAVLNVPAQEVSVPVAQAIDTYEPDSEHGQ